MQGKTGHLWQGRFYSSPVDEQFFWVTLRYIERNPVEAGLVLHASEYKWSSASAHCGFTVSALLTKDENWNEKLKKRSNWYNWLKESDSQQQTMRLEQCTHRDLPCGSEQFLDKLETKHGLDVRLRIPGRPKKEEMVYS